MCVWESVYVCVYVCLCVRACACNTLHLTPSHSNKVITLYTSRVTSLYTSRAPQILTSPWIYLRHISLRISQNRIISLLLRGHHHISLKRITSYTSRAPHICLNGISVFLINVTPSRFYSSSDIQIYSATHLFKRNLHTPLTNFIKRNLQIAVAVWCSVAQHADVWWSVLWPTWRCSVMQCGAVRRRVLQWVAVCCSALQCAAVCCRVLQCVAVYCSALQCVAVCCSAMQCVAVRCSALQCGAVRCSTLQCVAACWHTCNKSTRGIKASRATTCTKSE